MKALAMIGVSLFGAAVATAVAIAILGALEDAIKRRGISISLHDANEVERMKEAGL